jgi:hypothetical protein
MGMEINHQEHTRFLEWFRPPKRKTLHALCLFSSWESSCTKLEEACAQACVSVSEGSR